MDMVRGFISQTGAFVSSVRDVKHVAVITALTCYSKRYILLA
jgi:hypothetical protein